MNGAQGLPSQTSNSSGWLSVLLSLIGAILLVPGACAILFMYIAAFKPEPFIHFNDPLLIVLWLVCFAISLGGSRSFGSRGVLCGAAESGQDADRG